MQKTLIFLATIALFACKASKNTPSATATDTISTVTEVADTSMRFIVSFYSIGSGIEGNLLSKFKAFTGEYLKDSNQKISYTEVHWGDEGEADFCLPLKELTSAQQLDFITKTRELLQSAKYVHFFENKECRKRQ